MPLISFYLIPTLSLYFHRIKYVSTVTTWNQYILCYFACYLVLYVSTVTTWEINLSMYAFDIFLLLILASFDTHDIESMQAIVLCLWSFDTQDILLPVTSLNNGPIFNPIKLLELSQSPLSFCGVYMVFTYVSTVTTCFPLILVLFCIIYFDSHDMNV